MLVNNAGLYYAGPVETIVPQQLISMAAVNLTAPMLLSHLLASSLLRRAATQGAIVSIASGAGKNPYPEHAGYCATKFGVAGMTQALHEELFASGIRCTTVYPGYVNTDMVADVPDADPNNMLQPSDVADAVVFALTAPGTSAPTNIELRPQRQVLP